MLNIFIIFLGKFISELSTLFNLGNGSTWPGHIALKLNKHFINQTVKKSHLKIILIAGTNGKTTTASLLKYIMDEQGLKVIQNQSGANLLNGIASAIVVSANLRGKIQADYAIFEIDENMLPLVINEVSPNYILLINLFRDQLDRYGEIQNIARKWEKALNKLSPSTTLIINADDPQLPYIAKNVKAKQFFFGLETVTPKTINMQHAADSIYCPACGKKLTYKNNFFSHLGIYSCTSCGFNRPQPTLITTIYPLPGLYNRYNALAATLTARRIGIKQDIIQTAFSKFKPVFGRQEIIRYKGKRTQLFLSKNPTSFNQSYITIKNLGAKFLLIVLNDRIPDGRDISWIWDVDLPDLNKFDKILLAGDRVYDMALRLKYENYTRYQTFENLISAVSCGIDELKPEDTLFILPTYSAMLDVRKILTGKKIL